MFPLDFTPSMKPLQLSSFRLNAKMKAWGTNPLDKFTFLTILKIKNTESNVGPLDIRTAIWIIRFKYKKTVVVYPALLSTFAKHSFNFLSKAFRSRPCPMMTKQLSRFSFSCQVLPLRKMVCC